MHRINLIFLICGIVFLHASSGMSQSSESGDAPGVNRTVQTQPLHLQPVLTLGDAMARALAHSPVIQSAEYQHRADKAREDARMDGTPNPELSVAAEDFLGNGVARGMNAVQVTTALSQEVELGKKAAHRRDVRSTRRQISVAEYEWTRQRVLTDVATAFLEVLIQQERLTHTEEMVQLSQKTVDTIGMQVEAGRSSGMEKEKAVIELALAKLGVQEAKRSLASANIRLAAVCGDNSVFFEQVEGTLDAVSPLPPLKNLLKGVDTHPQLRVSREFVRHQQALTDAEKAGAVPNITFELGYRWNNASSNHALVAGVGVPLPLMDRNKGNINAAMQEVLRAESEADILKIELKKEIAAGYQSVEYELQRLKVLQDEIKPGVTATFAAVEEGYRIGRFGYLDLLDAQRTLFEVEHMLLDALMKYQSARIMLNLAANVPVSKKMFNGSKSVSSVSPVFKETP